MLRSLRNRVTELEVNQDGNWSPAQVQAAARRFEERIRRMTEHFSEADADLTQEHRIEKMSPAEHYAWLLRFEGEADLADVKELHGRGRRLPRNPIEMIHIEMNARDLKL